MKIMKSISVLVMTLLTNTYVNAQEAESVEPNAEFEAKIREKIKQEDVEAGKRQFGGINFGVGVSLTFDRGEERVKSASIVNGIVRVDHAANANARVMLESHYFFKPKSKLFGSEWGWGPFIALQPGTEEIIEAVALGAMIGFKRSKRSDDDSSWNLGVGWVIDPNIQVLGDGLKPNMPLPTGETEIRFKSRAKHGLLVMFTASF